MKQLFVLLTLALLALSSCERMSDGGIQVPVEQAGDITFEVRILFELDGVRVYRFFDDGEYRYFTIGSGSFQPQVQKRTVSTGKTSYVAEWSDGAETR